MRFCARCTAVAELAGVRVVVTRPSQQAASLVRSLEAQGAEAIRFPLIEIRAAADTRALDDVIARLDTFDIAIFISRNAVSYGLEYVRARRSFPTSLAIAAVGPTTAGLLAESGLPVSILPADRFDTEGLLAHPELTQIAGKRVVIFRGRGGRELLAQTLRERGAHVEYAECYVQAVPDRNPAPLVERLARGEVDVVTVTSTQGLRNLIAFVGAAGRDGLFKTALVVSSERIAEAARSAGFETPPIVAKNATDAGLIEALIDWRGRGA